MIIVTFIIFHSLPNCCIFDDIVYACIFFFLQNAQYQLQICIFIEGLKKLLALRYVVMNIQPLIKYN